MWMKVLRFVLGALAEIIVPFVKHLRAARLDDPSVIEIVDRIVGNLASRSDLSGELKRTIAVRELKAWGAEVGRDIRDSIAATLIELGVQRMKAAG